MDKTDKVIAKVKRRYASKLDEVRMHYQRLVQTGYDIETALNELQLQHKIPQRDLLIIIFE